MVAMHDRGEGPLVAVLGTGIMGSAMARRLIGANLRTTVWDRSPSATSPLLEAGARVARSPDVAVRDAAIVITMLPTADVVDVLQPLDKLTQEEMRTTVVKNLEMAHSIKDGVHRFLEHSYTSHIHTLVLKNSCGDVETFVPS